MFIYLGDKLVKYSSPDKIVQSTQVQNHLTEGIKFIYDLLYETYGPYGRNVVIDSIKTNNIELSKQGSKILSKLRISDVYKNLVILLIQDSFQKINNISGDGSKTFFLISSSLILNGFKQLSNQIDMFQIQLGIQQTLDYSLSLLSEKAEPIQSNKVWDKAILQFTPPEDNIPSMIKKIFDNIGKSGRIKLDLAPGQTSSVEIEHGLQLNRGYFSPYFITDTNKMLVNFENPYILLSKQKISIQENQLVRILELLIHTNRPLVIISPDIDEEALSTLVLNKINGIIDLAYIKLPLIFGSDTNTLDDLAIYTGAKVLNNYTQFKLFELTDLGLAKKVVITKTKTTIWTKTSENSELITQRANSIKKQILMTNSTYENEKLADRYKNFNTSNAILKVGGVTDLETEELRSRVENALIQLKGCLYDGVLSGGILNYSIISEELENWSRTNLHGSSLIGSKLVINAFLKPLQAIINAQRQNSFSYSNNSSYKSSEQIYSQSVIGYKTIKNNIKKYFEDETIDSFKNMKIQLQTAASLTNSLLSIGHFVL